MGHRTLLIQEHHFGGGVGRIQAWALIVWKRHSVPVGNYSFVANSSKCCSSFLCILLSFYFKWNRTGRTTPERIFVLQRELGVKSVGSVLAITVSDIGSQCVDDSQTLVPLSSEVQRSKLSQSDLI